MSEFRPPRYLKPMNKFMMAVQKLGIPTGPAMVLTVPGRKTGKPRSTPMTPFEHDGDLYVVAGYQAPTGRPTRALPEPALCHADANRGTSTSSN
jgi:F420H(2)-dependent quinone reductase